MSTEIIVDEWRAGTEAIGLCMICGGEYESTSRECPRCHVSLSVVRRCPKCRRAVSARHTKCIYCRTPFTHGLPENFSPAEEQPPQIRRTKSPRRVRAAAVSVVTFVVMFVVGLVFLHQANRLRVPAVHIVARSYVLHPAELRLAPSLASSIIEKVASGASVNLTGYRNDDQEHGWMALDWRNGVAYAPAADFAAPNALDTGEGANLLKSYLSAMQTLQEVDSAVRAVDYYCKAFPGDIHGEELRWILAERIRSISRHGDPRETTLRQLAQQQYKLLAASQGGFAGKAREAMVNFPSASGSGSHASSPAK